MEWHWTADALLSLPATTSCSVQTVIWRRSFQAITRGHSDSRKVKLGLFPAPNLPLIKNGKLKKTSLAALASLVFWRDLAGAGLWRKATDGELGLTWRCWGGLGESQAFSGQRRWEFCEEEVDNLCLSGRRFSFMELSRQDPMMPFSSLFSFLFFDSASQTCCHQCWHVGL